MQAIARQPAAGEHDGLLPTARWRRHAPEVRKKLISLETAAFGFRGGRQNHDDAKAMFSGQRKREQNALRAWADGELTVGEHPLHVHVAEQALVVVRHARERETGQVTDSAVRA